MVFIIATGSMETVDFGFPTVGLAYQASTARTDASAVPNRIRIGGSPLIRASLRSSNGRITDECHHET